MNHPLSNLSAPMVSTLRSSLGGLMKNRRSLMCGFTVLISVGLTACATPVGEVDQWGISGSEVAEFSGEVVDVLCELSGNCADQCGSGTRQLGIKTEQGTVLIAKDLNRYTGAAEELWPFCNQQLVVNGQFTESGPTRFFQIQNVRKPDGDWKSTSRFLEVWAEKNGKPASAANKWYFEDPRIEAILEQDGLLGLGPNVNP